MRNRLKEYIGTIQLMEQYSIGFLRHKDDKLPKIESEIDAWHELCEITERIQILNSKKDLLPYIEKEDLNAIAYFLSDKCSQNEDWSDD